MRRVRPSGLALMTAFWWVIGTSALLLVVFQWTQWRSLNLRRLVASSDRLHLAEGIVLREIHRIKASSWSRRWYALDARPESTHGQSITGSFGDSDYVGHVQDVADFWAGTSAVLEGHTDIFLEVAPPRGTSGTTARHFFARVVFRTPGPTRPTAFAMRRFVPVAAFDPADEGARAKLLTLMNQEEIRREQDRPASDVLARTVDQLARQSLTLREIALAVSDRAVDAQVELERSLSSRLRKGLSYLAAPVQGSGTGPGRYESAVGELTRAVDVARTQDRANGPLTLPRALHALARAEFDLARTYPCCWPACTKSSPCPLHKWVAKAIEHLTEITRDHRFDGLDWPARTQAPHALLMRSIVRLAQAHPLDLTARKEALAESIRTLDELRTSYPGFHLWGEPAVTGRRHDGASLSDDELVWFQQGLSTCGALVMGGAADGEALASVLRYSIAPNPAGSWTEVGRLRTPRSRFATAMTMPRPGRSIGGRILVFGGLVRDKEPLSSIEWYDPVFNVARPCAATLPAAVSSPVAVELPSGSILVAGGADAAGQAVSTCSLFDPETETISPAGSLSTPREGARAIPVEVDGRPQVFIVGGAPDQAARSGEIYDPESRQSTAARNQLSMVRYGAAVAPAGNGSILIAGGSRAAGDEAGATDTVETFVPAKKLFWPGEPKPTVAQIGLANALPIGKMVTKRLDHWALPVLGAVLMGNGRGPKDTASIEAFSWMTRSFSSVCTLPVRGSAVQALTLSDRRLLMVGGLTSGGSAAAAVLTTDSEIPRLTPELDTGRTGFTLVPSPGW